MNYIYSIDSRFDMFRGGWSRQNQLISSALDLVLMRLVIGMISGITLMIRVISKLGPAITKLNDIGQSSTAISLIAITSAYALLIALIIAEVVLFVMKKKLFLFLYIIMAAALAVTYYFDNPFYGYMVVILESIIIAYLFNSKYAAVRFRFYNKMNIAALNAYAVAQTENAIAELEEATRQYRDGTINEKTFKAKKAVLLRRI